MKTDKIIDFINNRYNSIIHTKTAYLDVNVLTQICEYDDIVLLFKIMDGYANVVQYKGTVKLTDRQIEDILDLIDYKKTATILNKTILKTKFYNKDDVFYAVIKTEPLFNKLIDQL